MKFSHNIGVYLIYIRKKYEIFSTTIQYQNLTLKCWHAIGVTFEKWVASDTTALASHFIIQKFWFNISKYAASSIWHSQYSYFSPISI